MAISGSRDFILNRNQVCAEALEKVGAIALGDNPDDATITSAARKLNIMVSSWQNDNVFLWTRSDDLQLLTDGTANYTQDANIIEFENPISRVNDGDTNIRLITKQEYDGITNKKTEGRPNQMYVDFQLAAPVLYLWPVPDNTTSVVTGSDSNAYLNIVNHTSSTDDKPITGSNYATYWASTNETSGGAWATATTYKSDVLRFSKVLRLQDFDATANNPDFPVRFYQAMVDGLAWKLAPVHGLTVKERQDLKEDFIYEYQKARGGNTEIVDLMIEPELVRF
jgi:hypothetical protein|tara:strand:- start:661 stop:1503 length:843 start_codon:yes stop_codon:yes gene_type:complete